MESQNITEWKKKVASSLDTEVQNLNSVIFCLQMILLKYTVPGNTSTSTIYNSQDMEAT